MKNAPNSKVNLDKAILRFAGDVTRANELRNLMANTIVAQLIGEGVVKGGTGLKFRYGEKMTRVTLDLDTAWKTDLDGFLKGLKSRLAEGWFGFSGEVLVRRQASPRTSRFRSHLPSSRCGWSTKLHRSCTERVLLEADVRMISLTFSSSCGLDLSI